MNSAPPTSPGRKTTAAVTAAVATAWLILVNLIFFWDRVTNSLLVRRLLERAGF